jgi:integrase
LSGGTKIRHLNCVEEKKPGKPKEDQMALAKRGKTWHTHFVVDGVRYRQSLHTSDWRTAQSKERELIAQAKQGKLSASSQEFARLPFGEAADRYLESRAPELSASSQQKERQLLVRPRQFLGALRLREITAEILLTFRQSRSAAGLGPAIINMEMGVIRRILKRAKRWSMVGDDIHPLKEPRSIGRALSHEEKTRLLYVADTNPEWKNTRIAITLALCTTMRGVEIKNLRWRDVDLLSNKFTVRRSKTDAGVRSIPMNPDAREAVLELREAARGIGAVDPDHYIFPACEHGRIDPTHHQNTFRTAWRKLTKAIKCPDCGEWQNPAKCCHNSECKANIETLKSPIAGLRFHDLRHHAITELAESQTSDATIMAIAGHVSRKMLEHYSHVRGEAKREAVNVLSAKRPGQPGRDGYDTSRDTKQRAEPVPGPEVLENMVGTRRLELLTSTVSR